MYTEQIDVMKRDDTHVTKRVIDEMPGEKENDQRKDGWII